MSQITCDMRENCTKPITHIGYKGFVYCTEHARGRRHYAGENCRKMRVWELRLIEAGEPLPSYKPIRKPRAPIPIPVELVSWESGARGLPTSEDLDAIEAEREMKER